MSVDVVGFFKINNREMRIMFEIFLSEAFRNKTVLEILNAQLWTGEWAIGSIASEHRYTSAASFLEWVENVIITEESVISIAISVDRFLPFKRPEEAVVEKSAIHVVFRGKNVNSSKRGWVEGIFGRKEEFSPRHSRTASDRNIDLMIKEIEVFLECFPEAELYCGAEGSPIEPSLMFMVYLSSIERFKDVFSIVEKLQSLDHLADLIDDHLENLDYLPLSSGLLVYSKKYSDGDLKDLLLQA